MTRQQRALPRIYPIAATIPAVEPYVHGSFVKDLPGGAHAGTIVDAILALARTLELDVVAEGIETGEQRDFLIARGCRLLQGFRLGKPFPIAEFEVGYGAGGDQALPHPCH